MLFNVIREQLMTHQHQQWPRRSAQGGDAVGGPWRVPDVGTHQRRHCRSGQGQAVSQTAVGVHASLSGRVRSINVEQEGLHYIH